MSESRTSSDWESEKWFWLIKKKEIEIAYIEDSGKWNLPVFWKEDDILMRLYNEGIKTRDCCINPEISKFSISAEQGVDWMSLVNSAHLHSIYSALTHASNVSEAQRRGSFFCFFLSVYTQHGFWGADLFPPSSEAGELVHRRQCSVWSVILKPSRWVQISPGLNSSTGLDSDLFFLEIALQQSLFPGWLFSVSLFSIYFCCMVWAPFQGSLGFFSS